MYAKVTETILRWVFEDLLGEYYFLESNSLLSRSHEDNAMESTWSDSDTTDYKLILKPKALANKLYVIIKIGNYFLYSENSLFFSRMSRMKRVLKRTGNPARNTRAFGIAGSQLWGRGRGLGFWRLEVTFYRVYKAKSFQGPMFSLLGAWTKILTPIISLDPVANATTCNLYKSVWAIY